MFGIFLAFKPNFCPSWISSEISSWREWFTLIFAANGRIRAFSLRNYAYRKYKKIMSILFKFGLSIIFFLYLSDILSYYIEFFCTSKAKSADKTWIRNRIAESEFARLRRRKKSGSKALIPLILYLSFTILISYMILAGLLFSTIK